MGAPYFIKEHLWMGAFDEATLLFSTLERQTFPQRRNFLPQKDFFCLSIYCNCSRCGIQYFFRCKDFSRVCTFSLHEHKCLFGHVNILRLQIQALPEESNFFVLLRFTQTPQKKCKSIILSKECFYITKHLKFNGFSLLLKCLSNLSASASGGVQKYSSILGCCNDTKTFRI